MPQPKEIIGYIRHHRGKLGRLFQQFDLPLQGQCVSIVDAVDQFGGNHWRSETCESPLGVYPGHSLGVVPTRENSGVIVYSRKGNPIIGYISDIDNETLVAQELETLTGFGNWEKK